MCGLKLIDKKNTDEHTGIRRKCDKSGKGEWGAMVRACFEER